MIPLTAMPHHRPVLAHEATDADVADLFRAMENFEPVVQLPHGWVHDIRELENERGPAASPTAGPRAGLPQPDKSDANTTIMQRQPENASDGNSVRQDVDMSAETYAAVEEAIAAHLSEEHGTQLLLTDWYIVAASVGEEVDRTLYTHICSSSPEHSLEGLLAKGLRRMTGDEEYE